MPTGQATPLRFGHGRFPRVRVWRNASRKGRHPVRWIGLGLTALLPWVLSGCRTVHEPIVEPASIQSAPSMPPAAAPFVPEAVGKERVPGTGESLPHSSTGIVLLNPPAPPVEPPGGRGTGSGDPDARMEDDEDAAEPETLLIREPWPNPVARGGVEAGDFGVRFDAIQFGYDSHDLDFAARQRLTRYCAWLEEHEEAWVTLEGHCDERGSSDYNYNLGMTRAWAAKDWMVGVGIDPKRLHTISYGEEQPLVEGGSPEAYAINRRVEFRPFYPTRNGHLLTSLTQGPESDGVDESAGIPPAQPALKLEAPDAAWPPLTE